MLSQDQQSEISLLEIQLKSLMEKFDHAVKKDRVLGDVKKLFHELKIIAIRLEQLKEQRTQNQAESCTENNYFL